MTINTASISRLIRKGESQTVEFKQSFGKAAIETICAFANTEGGTVLLGVDDSGDVPGVQAAKAALKNCADQIAQGTGLHPSIKTVSAKGKSIVVIRVQESKVRPILYQGRAYKRSGSTTRQMSVEEIAEAALSHIGITWDAMPEPRARLSDISMSKVKAFIKMANSEKRRPVPMGTSPKELLRKLKLTNRGKPTRAAILLFGKEPQSFYSQAMLKIGRFRNETLIVDDRRIDGTIFDQVEGAISYFREKLDTRYKITGRPQREVIWEYPLKALREAVTNAICHRNYMSTRDTEIRIYDHELMVWNDGGLPSGLSVQALKKAHPSMPRNKQIAEIFYYAGMIEQWGGGTRMILQECANAKHPEPIFEQVQGFRVTFRKAAKKGTVQAPYKHRTSTVQVAPNAEEQKLGSAEAKLLRACAKPKDLREMMALLGLKNRAHFMISHIHPLLKRRLLAMMDPDAPTSPKQRYLTTKSGLAIVKQSDS